MEDFEYSVDICDRDWTSFAAECDECNLLPPSLAGLDDSGMSDIDDKVRLVQKVPLGASFSEVDPRGCSSSPADRSISRRGVTGMESILSGSEEDIHLQSINVFFEKLKSASEAEKLADPNQTKAPAQNVEREGGHHSDGQQANHSAPRGNLPTARTDEDEGTSVMRSPEPVRPEAELKRPRDASDAEGKVADPPTPLNVIEQEPLPPNNGLSTHLDMKWKKDSNASLTDSTDPSQTQSQESSPSSSVRRRRARKRRLELAERQGSVKPGDSEEEQQARRGWFDTRAAQQDPLCALKMPQRHAASPEYPSLNRLPTSVSAREMNGGHLSDPKGANESSESLFSQSGISGAGLTVSSAAIEQPVIALNPTVVSVLNRRRGHLATCVHPGARLHIDEEMIHIFCCENEQQRGNQTAADSPLGEEAGNSGAPCPRSLAGQCGTRLNQSPPPLSRPDFPNTKTTHRQRTESAFDDSNLRPSPYPPVSGENIPAQPAGPPALLPSSHSEVVSGRSAAAGRPETPPFVPAGWRESEHTLPSPSDPAAASSCCTLTTESGMSLSNGNVTDLSYSSGLSVSQNDSRCSEELPPPTEREEEEESLVPEADAVAPSPEAKEEPEQGPDSTRSVFAMSSFWSEMEKLTINDILGLRQMEQSASQSSLPPLRGGEKPAEFALTPSSLYRDELNPDQTSVPVPSEGPTLPVGRSADALVITGGTGLGPGSGQTAFRRICKTVSVQNLCGLDSGRQKDRPLPSLDEEDLEKVGRFPDGAASGKEDSSSSLVGIFQYLFGKQSHPQRCTGTASSLHTGGRSLPDTYDRFTSDCNMEAIVHPFVTARGRAKDGSDLSAGRTPQFPEPYENFFAPSSSDESGAESDEDSSGAVKAAGRLRRASNVSEHSTDIYDNFFTDCDFEQSFFWKNTFSFRNLLFTRCAEEQQTVSGSFAPQRPSGFQITADPLDALGNRECAFSDLDPAEDNCWALLPRHPFTHEDLRVAVPSPRLDAPLLPLRQSDMCLVCIAFASWVLKTANPQVGDAWKAVLLANVSALSAIRYLRKYVKDKAASEDILHFDS